MTRRSLLAALAAGLTLTLAMALAVQAHGGDEETTLSVEPDNLQAGGSVVLVGTGLEADSERTLVLAGPGMTVDLGTITTDADGMFQTELTIPSHMPAGSYELRAIGDEILTVSLALTAGEGAMSTAPGDLETVVPHERHAFELGVIGAVVLALLLVGGALIRFAERVPRPVPVGGMVTAAED